MLAGVNLSAMCLTTPRLVDTILLILLSEVGGGGAWQAISTIKKRPLLTVSANNRQ